MSTGIHCIYFFLKSAHVILLYNLTENRIYILRTGVKSTNQSHALTTTYLPVMCCVKGQPRGICHPKEASHFSYVSVMVFPPSDPLLYAPSPFFGGHWLWAQGPAFAQCDSSGKSFRYLLFEKNHNFHICL